MPGLIDLTIDTKTFNSIATSMAADEKSINLALSRALRKTGRWVVTHLARELARETGIKVSTLKKRLKPYFDAKSLKSKVWVGLLPFSAGHMRPKATSMGVKAGGHYFDKAFIVKTDKAPLVFKRVGKTSLPIEKQVVSIEQQADTVIENTILPKLTNRLTDMFTQELRWILSQSR